MKAALKVISYLALIVTVLPSILFLKGFMDLDRVKFVMMAATVLWFAVTPFWMGKESKE